MNMFIAIYTNEVKKYCDMNFFGNVNRIAYRYNLKGLVIDNSLNKDYASRLSIISSFPVIHIDPPKSIYQFQLNVIESLKYLRQVFINGNYEKFLIIESDVIPPEDLIDRYLSYGKSGIVGCLYYRGFQHWCKEPERVNHALSGCTFYDREVIEKYPFRIDLQENHGAFPDAWICHDVHKDGDKFEIWNIPVECEHEHTVINGKLSRGRL
jgi:hypothetical protein